MKIARRIENLPPYLFAQIDKKVTEKKARGVDVISLGIGDPVEPTPAHIIEEMERALRNPANHRYPSYFGLPEFRQAVADWYKRRFKVKLDSDKEVLPLIGSKEGIAHIYLATVDSGELVLVPDPGYPVYETGAILAGAKAHFMPLLAENNFNPDLKAVSGEVAQKAKAMYLSYPNNPTAAVAKPGLFKEAIALAKESDLMIFHDNPYSEITYDSYIAPSFLETPGAKEVGVEFHSLSKTYNMTGWRIGFVVGNEQIIEALGRVKTNIDSGIFNAIQYAGIAALNGPQECVEEMRAIYQKRRNKVIKTLESIGIKIAPPKATIYIWSLVPEGYTSASFATLLLDKAGVVVPPGSGYGPSGEGYFRISLTVPDDRLEEALDRIKDAF